MYIYVDEPNRTVERFSFINQVLKAIDTASPMGTKTNYQSCKTLVIKKIRRKL